MLLAGEPGMSPLRLEEEVNTALSSGQTYRQVSHSLCFVHTECHATLVLPIAAAAAAAVAAAAAATAARSCLFLTHLHGAYLLNCWNMLLLQGYPKVEDPDDHPELRCVLSQLTSAAYLACGSIVKSQ